MPSRHSLYALLFILSILTSGASILFLTHTAHVSGTKVASEYPAPTSNDAYQYALLGENLVNHQVFSESTSSPYIPDTFRTPGYPVFIALLFAVFGSLYAVLVVQIGRA